MDSRCKILVVDDDPHELFATARCLERAGFPVVTASDGKSSLEVFDAEKPDLVILDVVMPSPNGLEVCRRIQKRRRNRDLLVLLISSKKTDTQDRIQGLSVGADGYLIRPLDPQEFVAQIEAYARICERLKRRHVELKKKVGQDLDNLLKTVETQKKVLDERTRALKSLAKQLQDERAELESHFTDNLRNVIAPLLRCVVERSGPLEAWPLELIDEQIQRITDPFGSRLDDPCYALTPREKEICSLVRFGRNSKEIANLLNLSIHTVSTHRARIRRKLHLPKGTPLVQGLKKL